MIVEVTIGRVGVWYEKEVGNPFEVEDIPNGYGDHKLLDSSDGYNRWINKRDFKEVNNETAGS